MSELAPRDATEADLDVIRAIYNHYVATSTCTFQLEADTADDTKRWFRERDPSVHPVIVTEREGVVIGWGSLHHHKTRRGYRFTVENSVYVDHHHHGGGVGSALLVELVARARAAGHHSILAGVETAQVASLRLHQRHGFVRVSHLREVGYKFERWLDVVYLQLMLQDAPTPPPAP
ncbi:MAG: N-acetyltransferase family protein [Polyangiaceae bacterium]